MDPLILGGVFAAGVGVGLSFLFKTETVNPNPSPVVCHCECTGTHGRGTKHQVVSQSGESLLLHCFVASLSELD